MAVRLSLVSRTMRDFGALFVVTLAASFSLLSASAITELRAKVGDVLEKLHYPSKLATITKMNGESVLKLAVDFATGIKPQQLQFALAPRNPSLLAIVFDMDFKAAASKATLNVDFGRIDPRLVSAGEEYDLELYLGGGAMDPITWQFGHLQLAAKLDTQIPEVEDHFYALPEQTIPAEKSTEGDRNPLIPLVGTVLVLLPWIAFMKLWRKSGVSMKPPGFLFTRERSRYYPLFTAAVCALLAVIVAAWVYLSIFQTLGFVAVLASVALVFGFKSFQSIVAEEAGQQRDTKTTKSD